MECTIGFAGVFEQRHLLSRSGDRHYDSFFDHVIEGVLNLFPILNGDLLLGMMDWRTLGSVLMV